MKGDQIPLHGTVVLAMMMACTSVCNIVHAQPVPVMAPSPLVAVSPSLPGPVSAPAPSPSGSSPNQATPLPYIMLHGLTDSCDQSLYMRTDSAIKAAIPGIYGYCMEIGNGQVDSLVLPMMTQVQIVCDQVRADPFLAGGFNLVGFSQGALTARGYVELCDGPPVNHFVSLGGPQAGAASLPSCNKNPEFNALNFPCLLLNAIGGVAVYSPDIQDHLAPTNYAVLPGLYDLYLKQSTFLPIVNNERPDQRNETYKQRFVRLNNLTLVQFSEDNVLIPVQTAWFGFYPPYNPFTVWPYNATALYQQDLFGLQTLDRQGKVAFVNAPGVHLNVTYALLRDVIIPALLPPASPSIAPAPEVMAPAPSAGVGSSTMGP